MIEAIEYGEQFSLHRSHTSCCNLFAICLAHEMNVKLLKIYSTLPSLVSLFILAYGTLRQIMSR